MVLALKYWPDVHLRPQATFGTGAGRAVTVALALIMQVAGGFQK